MLRARARAREHQIIYEKLRCFLTQVDSNQKAVLKTFILKGFRTVWQLCDKPFPFQFYSFIY